jgi:hypothetical protein
MRCFLLLLGLVGLAAAGKPFVQTPEFIKSMFSAGQTGILQATPTWKNIGPDRTSEAWAQKQVKALWMSVTFRCTNPRLFYCFLLLLGQTVLLLASHPLSMFWDAAESNVASWLFSGACPF